MKKEGLEACSFKKIWIRQNTETQITGVTYVNGEKVRVGVPLLSGHSPPTIFLLSTTPFSPICHFGQSSRMFTLFYIPSLRRLSTPRNCASCHVEIKRPQIYAQTTSSLAEGGGRKKSTSIFQPSVRPFVLSPSACPFMCSVRSFGRSFGPSKNSSKWLIIKAKFTVLFDIPYSVCLLWGNFVTPLRQWASVHCAYSTFWSLESGSVWSVRCFIIAS